MSKAGSKHFGAQEVVRLEGGIHLGDLAEDGGQLRPHIVWLGESVLEIVRVAEWASMADILLVIGTSLVVYPAAGPVDYAPDPALC